MTSSTIAHVVLTGGPCAGKTSALGYLADQLTVRGWRVLMAPEAATVVITGGLDDIGLLASGNRPAYLAVQHEVVSLQRNFRDRFDALARAVGAPKTVVLHDRGIADNAAYMSAEEYATVLAAAGLNVSSAYDLYDAVVHLRSAAVTNTAYAGDGYSVENNTARQESSTAAAALDAATLTGWEGHPHLAVVAAGESFTLKLRRTLATVLRALGDPEPVEVERKYALTGPPDMSHPVLAAAAQVSIEQIYLPDTGTGEARVRARTLAGVSTHTHATKTDISDGARIEIETQIGAETYRLLAQLRDPETSVIRKTRHIFVHADQRFELDHITSPRETWVLEAELVDVDDPVTLPDFLPPVHEVTGDPSWRNRALATRRTPTGVTDSPQPTC